MVSATDGSAFTSAVTVAVTLDAGTQATGSVGSGACTHEGNGYHTYAPSQAETNGDLVAFTFTGTGAIPQTQSIYTKAGDVFTRVGAPAGASVSADVAAVKADTAANAAAVAALNNLSSAQVLTQAQAALTTAVADSIPADGSRPSIAQGILMICQFLFESGAVGTTVTVKKPDGSTTLFTLTTNNATTPTSITRTT